MTQKEFMEWILTFPRNDDDGPFCPFPLGGYCDNPLSEDCVHCEFCLQTDSIYIKDIVF